MQALCAGRGGYFAFYVRLECSPKKRVWFCYGMESSMLGICAYRALEEIPDGAAARGVCGDMGTGNVAGSLASEIPPALRKGRRQTHIGSTAMLARLIRSV